MRTRFRGITVREGVIFERGGRWREWSPFIEYEDSEAATWLKAALSDDEPELNREKVPINVTVPVVSPGEAADLVRESKARTAKIKVADPRSDLSSDVKRLEAVRNALPDGNIRIDANGAWSLDEAMKALRAFASFNLQYVEQPCASVTELAQLRKKIADCGLDIMVAADESIRRAQDPYRVKELNAADIVVCKVQPLGGVSRLLEVAEKIGRPVVVSSALETSIGIAAGLRAACALPELELACGLDTVRLLDGDLTDNPVVSKDGFLRFAGWPIPDERKCAKYAASRQRSAWWQARFERCLELIGNE